MGADSSVANATRWLQPTRHRALKYTAKFKCRYAATAVTNSLQKVCPAYINKCSTMGPRLSTGKKVNAPTMMITLTNSVVNNGVVTGKVPSDGGTIFLRPRLPATASIGMIIKNLPNNMAMPMVV